MLGRRGLVLILLVVAATMMFGACKEYKKAVTVEEDTGDLPRLVNDNRATTDASDDDAADDDAADDDATDDDATDDDAADDDAADDDAADDDTTDDWQQDLDGPVLSGGAWDPTEMSTEDAVSTLSFAVCDEENNLSGGQLFIYNAGTTDNFLAEDQFWDDFTGLDDVSDCGAPTEITVQVNFAGAPVGEYCADIRATDGEGMRSNIISDVCVSLVP